MVRVSDRSWCDPCLVPLVKALNDAGMPTVASCCGHGRRPSIVSLADGREVVVARSFEEARAIDGMFPVDINGQTTATHRAGAEPRDIEAPGHPGSDAR